MHNFSRDRESLTTFVMAPFNILCYNLLNSIRIYSSQEVKLKKKYRGEL